MALIACILTWLLFDLRHLNITNGNRLFWKQISNDIFLWLLGKLWTQKLNKVKLNQHRALSHPCSTDTLTQRGSPCASEINTQQKKTRNPISTRFKNSILYVRFDICICVINYASNWISAYKGNNWWWRIAILFIFKKELEIQVGKEEQAIWEYWISP